jgi:tRNA nucleotidyltransferase (CCA-adding enzyme)
MTLIREVMTTPAAGIRAEATLAEAIRFLTDHHIGGAPVVSEDNVIVGIISELALIDVVFDEAARSAPVSQYMTKEVQIAHPDEPLSKAAKLFALYSFRRLPVVENGKLLGVISRRDLMNYALRMNKTLREPLLELIPELAGMS